MDDKFSKIVDLQLEWDFFTTDVLMWKTFDEELFLKLFKETFEAARQYSCEDYIPRKVMGMFKSIVALSVPEMSP